MRMPKEGKHKSQARDAKEEAVSLRTKLQDYADSKDLATSIYLQQQLTLYVLLQKSRWKMCWYHYAICTGCSGRKWQRSTGN